MLGQRRLPTTISTSSTSITSITSSTNATTKPVGACTLAGA
jgi:hypothetical protein